MVLRVPRLNHQLAEDAVEQRGLACSDSAEDAAELSWTGCHVDLLQHSGAVLRGRIVA